MKKERKIKKEVLEGLIWGVIILAMVGGIFAGGFFAGRFFGKKVVTTDVKDEAKKELKEEIAKNVAGEESAVLGTFYGTITKKNKEYIEVKGMIEGLDALLEKEVQEEAKKIKVDGSTKIIMTVELDEATLNEQREKLEASMNSEEEEGVDLEAMTRDLENLQEKTEKEISFEELQEGMKVRVVTNEDLKEKDEFLALEIRVE
jgi:hypothetical protein